MTAAGAVPSVPTDEEIMEIVGRAISTAPAPWRTDEDEPRTLDVAYTDRDGITGWVCEYLQPEHAALIALSPTVIPALLERARRAETDAERYRYLREHCSYHYGMNVVEPSPAEWGIEWHHQQSKPGEQHETLDSLLDAAIEHQQAADAE
jgi:hypothetical protein